MVHDKHHKKDPTAPRQKYLQSKPNQKSDKAFKLEDLFKFFLIFLLCYFYMFLLATPLSFSLFVVYQKVHNILNIAL